MSRYLANHKSDPSKRCAYGFDGACHPAGYFASLYEEGEHAEELDTRRFLSDRKIDRMGLLRTLEQYEVPEEHMQALGLDMPF